VPIPLEIPQPIGQTLLALLAAPGGTTAEAAGAAIGKSKETARKYLKLLRDAGIARLNGAGPAARWYRTVPRTPGPAAEYTTLAELAEAVHNGQADAGDDLRAVLEQVRQITERQHTRAHLSLVPPPGEVTERDV
jgi:predicted ArsR family transcriptional regulator